MKKLYSILVAFIMFFATSCELDNYDGPDASVFGKIVDAETGELIEQEIGTSGDATNLQVIEYGYAYRNPQSWKITTTGEYRNNLVFSGVYDVILNKGNFVPIDTLKAYKFAPGDNVLDFKVIPNVRIKSAKVERVGTMIRATCKLEFANSIATGKIKKLAVFAQTDRFVSSAFNLVSASVSLEDRNLGNANKATYANEVFTVEIDTTKDPGSRIKAGKRYFFRIGALPTGLGENIVERYNYSPVVYLDI